jgi:hypothetical protein
MEDVKLFVSLVSCQCNKSLNRSFNNLAQSRAENQLDNFFTKERLNYFSDKGEWQGKELWDLTLQRKEENRDKWGISPNKQGHAKYL